MAVDAIDVSVDTVRLGSLARFGQLLLEGLVRGVECGNVCHDGHGTVDFWVLRVEFGLVKVVRVGHVGTMHSYTWQLGQQGYVNGVRRELLTFEDNRSIGPNQHGNSASTASWTGCALSIDSDIAGNNDGVTAVPGI